MPQAVAGGAAQPEHPRRDSDVGRLSEAAGAGVAAPPQLGDAEVEALLAAKTFSVVRRAWLPPFLRSRRSVQGGHVKWPDGC